MTAPVIQPSRWSRRKAVGGLIGLAGAAAGWGEAQAQVKEVEGFRFDNTLRLGGSDLVLNGVGVRRRFFIPVYVAGLYVPARSGD
nr:chalcone isomerase family protein [Burkholderiaceae bacterium]